MTPKTRFIKSVIATAKTTDTRLPWQRESKRSVRIANAKPAATLKHRA